MNDNTFLYRQIYPEFTQLDRQDQQVRPTSQAFLPSASDGKLSVYDGDQITAEASWFHYTDVLKLASCGVAAFTVSECRAIDLPVISDGIPYPEHISVDFTWLSSRSQRATRAKQLRAAANARGWQFRPVVV